MLHYYYAAMYMRLLFVYYLNTYVQNHDNTHTHNYNYNYIRKKKRKNVGIAATLFNCLHEHITITP